MNQVVTAEESISNGYGTKLGTGDSNVWNEKTVWKLWGYSSFHML